MPFYLVSECFLTMSVVDFALQKRIVYIKACIKLATVDECAGDKKLIVFSENRERNLAAIRHVFIRWQISYILH